MNRLLRLTMVAASVCVGMVALAGTAANSDFVAVAPHEQVKEMGRGVNILGYDPFWRDTNRARFKAEHFKRIREGGFQTVRVNLHAFAGMDSENRLKPDWLQKLDWVVDNALAAGLVVILDEHNFQAFSKDAEDSKPRLLAFWRQVSERYKGKPNKVIFEILNEPNGKLDDEAWNALLKEALAIIRESNPTRNVVIGPASWNGIGALPKLQLPSEDRHIIVTVHYYLPMRFTHQGASWSKGTAHLSNVTWGTDAERSKVESDFGGVQAWARDHDRPIFLGEFGAYDKAPLESRVRYTSVVARTAEAQGWAWAYWQFDSDFIVFDMAMDDWNTPIYKALVP